MSTTQTDTLRIQKYIEQILNEKRHSCITAAFVGSASPQSKERNKELVDVDLLLLWHDHAQAAKAVSELEERLATFAPSYLVVDHWGLVAPPAIHRNVIHIHNDTAEHYLLRSTLFRRSVAKYAPVLGAALDQFSPPCPLSVTELLEDTLSPVNHLKRLERKEFKFKTSKHSGKVDSRNCLPG
jgi:hypothetical protein